MRRGNGMIEELCHAAEGMSGTAASASLRRLGSLMERAPAGRSFDAISTLAELSARAALTLQDAAHALAQSGDIEAARHLELALLQMNDLAAKGTGPKARRRAAG